MVTLRIRAAVLTASAMLATAWVLATAVTADATTPACGNTALSVSRSSTQGATGHGSVVLRFRNVSSSSCSLYGYPGLDALNSAGHAIAHAQRTLSGFAGGVHAENTAIITPGHYGSATVEWLNFNPVTAGDCTFSAALATTPPNTTHTVHLPVSVSICKLQVHPVVAGTTGIDGFTRAKAAWQNGATAISARQGTCWADAENDLKMNGPTYATAIKELSQLITLPDANQTPAQNLAYRHDISALNTLFGTPGLYS
jgi:hypothetical protein